eukprot:534644-Prymnesium_polylepis.1
MPSAEEIDRQLKDMLERMRERPEVQAKLQPKGGQGAGGARPGRHAQRPGGLDPRRARRAERAQAAGARCDAAHTAYPVGRGVCHAARCERAVRAARAATDEAAALGDGVRRDEGDAHLPQGPDEHRARDGGDDRRRQLPQAAGRDVQGGRGGARPSTPPQQPPTPAPPTPAAPNSRAHPNAKAGPNPTPKLREEMRTAGEEVRDQTARPHVRGAQNALVAAHPTHNHLPSLGDDVPLPRGKGVGLYRAHGSPAVPRRPLSSLPVGDPCTVGDARHDAWARARAVAGGRGCGSRHAAQACGRQRPHATRAVHRAQQARVDRRVCRAERRPSPPGRRRPILGRGAPHDP